MVRIAVASGKGLTVPARSIVEDGAEPYVLVEASATSAGSEYRRKSVVVAAKSDGWAQIVGEVFAGDRVMTAGCHSWPDCSRWEPFR